MLFAVVLVTEVTTLLLARQVGAFPSIWTSNGIVAGALVMVPRRYWPYFIVATLCAMLIAQLLVFGTHAGGTVTVASIVVLANGVEILIVAGVLRHYFPQFTGDITKYARLGRVGTVAVVVACLVSTLFAWLAQRIGNGAFLGTPSEWFRAHLLGMVMLGTVTLVALRQRKRMLGEPGKRLRMLRDILLFIAIALGVFVQTRFPLLFVTFGPVLYLVFRYRFVGLVYSLTCIALITNVATNIGEGPFNLIPLATAAERTLLAQIYLGVLCAVALPTVLIQADRLRLRREAQESETRYRLLADYATDLIMRVARDGTRRYVSPSVKIMLGWEVEEYIQLGQSLIHPDDRPLTLAAMERLWETRKPSLTRYRVRRRSGDYLWIEGLGNIAPSPDHPGELEMVYTGRDVTESVLAEHALAESEKRLRTITDNVPALIAHVDNEERYTFVNAYATHVVGTQPDAVVGKKVQDVRGAAVYSALKPHIALALAGTTTTFEYETEDHGKPRYLQATYLPAITANGQQNGFYTLATDITAIKRAEQQLAFLAHHDALTGIANRLSFREGINLAVSHAIPTRQPLLLMMIDVDHFKQINDTHGHAAGDIALREVAARLKASIRKTDLLARLGGDEFVILCRDVDDVAIAEGLAQKITEAMREPVAIGDHALKVTLSIGAALCHEVGNAEALLQRADDALYQAKAAGRDCYRVTTDRR